MNMKFTALLSGGKDSCYNITLCQALGHELVCTANLYPPADDEVEVAEASSSSSSCNTIKPSDDMESYMYQTAAHNVIPCISECLGVPLIRRCVMGSAVNKNLDYSEINEDDEVEDLFILLNEVKTTFPDCQGVSCGAIISNYQRLRLESVCSRLGMTPLCFMWERERAEILDEICAAGVEAVVVRVAGAGLDPQKHLVRLVYKVPLIALLLFCPIVSVWHFCTSMPSSVWQAQGQTNTS
jgi:diphthine-ammonia ligase